MVTITLQLDKDTEAKARAAGLLTSEKLAELIEAELEQQRQEAAARLFDTMDKLSSALREEYGDLTDEEAQAMLDQWIAEAEDASDHPPQPE